MNEKEKEIMLIAQEECAEVTQAISKVFRFGYTAIHPDGGKNNRERLEEEIGDMLCMIDLMIEKNIVDKKNLMQASANKRKKLEKWSNIFYE
jgi:NTP pyrophosphatase (non-canonical NTP hydrolase)